LMSPPCAMRMVMSFRRSPNAEPGIYRAVFCFWFPNRCTGRVLQVLGAANFLVSQTFPENQWQRIGSTEQFRLSGSRTFLLQLMWSTAATAQGNWAGLSKQVSNMLLGMQNAVLLHWKHIESWRQSTWKLKNGWENGFQSYSFTDSCGILTWSNFFVQVSCFAWNRRHFFSAGPTPCFSPVSPVSPFVFVYSLYTFSSAICRDFARALRKLCSFPLWWATGTRYLWVTKIFLLAVIITFKFLDGALWYPPNGTSSAPRHAQTVHINLSPCYAILITRRRMRTIACPTFVLFGWGWPNICSNWVGFVSLCMPNICPKWMGLAKHLP